jgi:hypothetical protein
VSPAHAELKDLTDRLSDDEAAAVLRVARIVSGTGRKARSRVRSLEDEADARMLREALAEPGEIPYDEYRRARGL